MPGTRLTSEVAAAHIREAGEICLLFAPGVDAIVAEAHALSLAALRIAGYRRYLVFQCLQHTLTVEKRRVLDQAHRKRNLAEWDGAADVDEGLVKALIRTTEEVAERMRSAGTSHTGVIPWTRRLEEKGYRRRLS